MMQAVILAGGLGTRLGEETSLRPKPMVEVGGMPILWHIMKIYSAHGVNDFVICLGYKGYVIKEFFANYFLHTADVTLDLAKNSVEVHRGRSEPWRVTLVDTGPDSQTGGRLKAVAEYIRPGEPFCFTGGGGTRAGRPRRPRQSRAQDGTRDPAGAQTPARLCAKDARRRVHNAKVDHVRPCPQRNPLNADANPEIVCHGAAEPLVRYP